MKLLFWFLLYVAISLTLGGWVIMITAGMIHSEVDPSFPAWSWRASVFVSIGLLVLGTYFRSYSIKR